MDCSIYANTNFINEKKDDSFNVGEIIYHFQKIQSRSLYQSKFNK